MKKPRASKPDVKVRGVAARSPEYFPLTPGETFQHDHFGECVVVAVKDNVADARMPDGIVRAFNRKANSRLNEG